MPAGVVNGSRTQGAKRSAIVAALAAGETVRAIARALKVGHPTVLAIKRAEYSSVEASKQRHAARAEAIASEASEQILDEIVRLRGTKHRLHPSALVPIYGVAIDKMLALRGDAVATFRFDHVHRLHDDDLLAFAVQRSKVAKATVVDLPALNDSPVINDNPVMNADNDSPVMLEPPTTTHDKATASARKKRTARKRR